MKNPFAEKNTLRITLLLAAIIVVSAVFFSQTRSNNPPIKIGVLHSLTGTMASSEAPLVDAIRLAVEEANREGGVNGQPIEMLVTDCKSDAAYCAVQAEKLISQDRVQALFGCWTSACRKAVKPVVEMHRHLLFYPVQYEGLEQSPNIIYTGAAPNQQIIPMALWAQQHFGKRFYLIGSDYIFPHTAHRIAKDILLAQGGQLLGERFVPLGHSNMSKVVQEIASLKPDFVLNTLNGDSNRYFFEALHAANITAKNIPVFSTSIAEVELAAMGPELMTGHYAGWNYFQSLDNAENKAFVARFQQRFGSQRVLNDPMEASYVGVKLWINSARDGDANNPAGLKLILTQESMPAPEGIVSVDYDTQHVWRTARIGKAQPNGQFETVWSSPETIHPAPFPFYHDHEEWRRLKLDGGRQ